MNFLAVPPAVMHHNVSKLDQADMTTAEMVMQEEKEIATSNHGSVDPQVLPLHGNNAGEMTAVTTTTVTAAAHLHGQLVVVAATITAAMDKVEVIAVHLAVELLLGNDRTMLLHLLLQAISMAMVDIREAMEARMAVTVVSRRWALLLVLVAGPVVLVLHQV